MAAEHYVVLAIQDELIQPICSLRECFWAGTVTTDREAAIKEKEAHLDLFN